MHSSNSVVPMRPKGARKDRRFAGTTNRQQEIRDKEAAKAGERLLVTLYRKAEGGVLVILLSELTLRRLADGVNITQSERWEELQCSVLAFFDRNGVVNHRVVRRQDDRLSIIDMVLFDLVEARHIEVNPRVRGVEYRLSNRQMKTQKRVAAEREQRISEQKEVRTRRRKNSP